MVTGAWINDAFQVLATLRKFYDVSKIEELQDINLHHLSLGAKKADEQAIGRLVSGCSQTDQITTLHFSLN